MTRGELQESLDRVKNSELNGLNEVVMKIIKKQEIDAKTYFVSLAEISKEWNDRKAKILKDEIENKSRLLEKKK